MEESAKADDPSKQGSTNPLALPQWLDMVRSQIVNGSTLLPRVSGYVNVRVTLKILALRALFVSYRMTLPWTDGTAW